MDELKRLPRPIQMMLALCIALGAYLCIELSYWWNTREDYSFGYVVPLFSLFVIHDRLRRLLTIFDSAPASAPLPHVWEKVLTVVFSLTFIMGAASYALGVVIIKGSGPSQPGSLAMAFGFTWIILSMVYLNASRNQNGKPLTLQQRLKVTALFLFPALVWLISAPLLTVIENRLSLFLLSKVTVVVLWFSDLLGMAIVREGNVLILPNGMVGVEDACSGIRSLTACLFAGSFLAAVFLKRFWQKLLLVGLALILAFITNLGRSLFLTLWAYHNGAESIEGAVHDVAGYAVLGVTTVFLFIICMIMTKIQSLVEAPPPPGASVRKKDTPEAS